MKNKYRGKYRFIKTALAVAVFGIKRQNMAAHVKEWQTRSSLPVYDKSKKAFVRTTGSLSLIYKDESSANNYLKSLETALSFISSRHPAESDNRL